MIPRAIVADRASWFTRLARWWRSSAIWAVSVCMECHRPTELAPITFRTRIGKVEICARGFEGPCDVRVFHMC